MTCTHKLLLDAGQDASPQPSAHGSHENSLNTGLSGQMGSTSPCLDILTFGFVKSYTGCGFFSPRNSTIVPLETKPTVNLKLF